MPDGSVFTRAPARRVASMCFGSRARARADSWAADRLNVPAPLLQALLSVMAEEGFDVAALRQELQTLFVAPVAHKPLDDELDSDVIVGR